MRRIASNPSCGISSDWDQPFATAIRFGPGRTSYRSSRLKALLHQINLGEVVYRIGKVHGWAVAERKRSEIGLLPIEVVKFSDTLFWDAVRLKAAYPISYADAFAAALAMAHRATLLTADPEFEVLGDRVMRVAV